MALNAAEKKLLWYLAHVEEHKEERRLPAVHAEADGPRYRLSGVWAHQDGTDEVIDDSISSVDFDWLRHEGYMVAEPSRAGFSLALTDFGRPIAQEVYQRRPGPDAV